MDPKRLRDVPLFASLGKKELQQLASWTSEVRAQPGDVLNREGAVAYEFCVILEGAAAVTLDGRHVRDLGAGDFFGEIALLERERRTATVTATTPVRLVVMVGGDFHEMERSMPDVARQVRDAIAERLERDAERAPAPEAVQRNEMRFGGQ